MAVGGGDDLRGNLQAAGPRRVGGRGQEGRVTPAIHVPDDAGGVAVPALTDSGRDRVVALFLLVVQQIAEGESVSRRERVDEIFAQCIYCGYVSLWDHVAAGERLEGVFLSAATDGLVSCRGGGANGRFSVLLPPFPGFYDPGQTVFRAGGALVTARSLLARRRRSGRFSVVPTVVPAPVVVTSRLNKRRALCVYGQPRQWRAVLSSVVGAGRVLGPPVSNGDERHTRPPCWHHVGFSPREGVPVDATNFVRVRLFHMVVGIVFVALRDEVAADVLFHL